MNQNKTRSNAKRQTPKGSVMQRGARPPAKQQQPSRKKARGNGNGQTMFAPSAQSIPFRANVPRISQNPTGVRSCRIQHRELIASVTGTVAFTVANSFALNPGLPATFPWLSTQAIGWEQYAFRRLSFHYVTRTGTNVPGSVMLAPDYDAADGAPADEATASSYQDAIEDAPWKDIVCHLKNSSMHGGMSRKFTRNDALAVNLDVKTYDAGIMHLLTVDGTAVSWGKLWVDYDVEFYVPQLPSGGVGPFGGRIINGGGSVAAATPFGGAPSLDAQSKGISMAGGTQVLVFAQLGTYILEWSAIGTVISAMTGTLGTGVTALATALTTIDAASTGSTWIQPVIVTSLSVSAPPTITFSMTATTVTNSILRVGQGPVGSYA